ncbi:hypothetical protein E3U43_010691 [Larimichthys crocea]|uniref:Uncharacterized protein n=1 Tax=Larimichthys crocea TaxID=215358 RepID=A0ACD3RG95_LARCR|nr:hypothetical protein E3U43_010691 [Larimichthys crocea]
MITKVEELTKVSKKLHELSDNVLATFAGVENRLDGLPNIKQNAEYFNSLQVNVYPLRAVRVHSVLQTARRLVENSQRKPHFVHPVIFKRKHSPPATIQPT